MRKKKRWIRSLRDKFKSNRLKKQCAQLEQQLGDALKKCTDDIPILIVSYNNGVYVDNTVRQLLKFNLNPIIIDNHSDDPDTLKTLNNLRLSKNAQVAFSSNNFGHFVGFIDPIYALLPEVFAYTDPDLEFNENLPADFMSVLSELTQKHSVYKAGFALDLKENAIIKEVLLNVTEKKPIPYSRNFTIREWESQFWRLRIAHDSLEIYAAGVDTTFAVCRKSNYIGRFFDGIRVAGNYSAIHLPWFPELDLMGDKEREKYMKKNKSTTWVEGK